MAVRTEKVRLVLEDDFTAGMERAAAASKLFGGSLDDLDGSHTKVSSSTRQLGADVDNTSSSFRKGESSLNQFTGRLATMARAAALVGPAVVPLTAGMVPALAGMTAGLGAAAGALGVTVLAANGLGDGLKALNDYQLEPTVANAEKLAQEMEKLGPAGEQFVRYIDSLGPQMKDLQNVAREGLLPGVEDGIESLLGRLPQVRNIVSDIATTMGDLSADAGAGLAGGGFDSFFEYLDNEAGPILRAFGETAGNIFETFANLLVGVDPLTQSFTQGLVSQSEALAGWSRGLADDEGFQSFIEYVQQSGPQALEFFGELVQAFAAIAQAAAPVGDVVLPILTGILQVTAAIAKSDLGTPIFATLAAMSALSTATKVWGAVSQTSAAQFITSQTAAAGAAGKSRASLAALGKSAGLVGGIVLATTAITELAAANDELEASSTRAKSALDRGDRSAALQNIQDLEKQTDALAELANTAATSNDPVESFMANFNPAAFQNNLKDLFGQSELQKRRDEIVDYKFALDGLQDSTTYRSLADLDPILHGNAAAFGEAANSAKDFANTLAQVDGVLGQRSAWREYQAAIDDAGKALETNGRKSREFGEAGRANNAALDRIGASAVKFAENLKGLDRVNFLAKARREFLQFARDIGKPRGEALSLARQLGLLSKVNAKPKVDVDTSTAKQREAEIRRLLRQLGLSRADPKVGMMFGEFARGDKNVLGRLRVLAFQKANPTVGLDSGQFQSGAAGVQRGLNGIDSKKVNPTVGINDNASGKIRGILGLLNSVTDRTATVTTYTRSIRVAERGADGMTVPNFDFGGTVPGQRQPYGDKVYAYLAPGEEVISNRFGQADRNRDLLKAINANKMAGGGTAGGDRPGDRNRDDRDGNRDRRAAIRELREDLREVSRQLRRTSRRLEENRDQLREMRQTRSEVGSSLAGELTGNGLAGFDLGIRANRNDAKAAAKALLAARRKGLDGPLFDFIAASGDLSLIQQFAGLSRAGIAQRERAFAGANIAQRNLGDIAVAEKFGRTIDGLSGVVREQIKQQRNLTRRQKAIERGIERATERGSRNGTRAGNRDRNRRNGPNRRNRRG